MTPTARTLALLRKDGYTAQVVERWNAFAKRRIDLFGCIDIVAIGSCILGVQACADGGGSGMASHRGKAMLEPRLRTWLEAGGKFEIWAWGKKGARGERKVWTCRREAITLADLEDAGMCVGAK